MEIYTTQMVNHDDHNNFCLTGLLSVLYKIFLPMIEKKKENRLPLIHSPPS